MNWNKTPKAGRCMYRRANATPTSKKGKGFVVLLAAF
jgi:hypothetical protein